ncbi:MAG: 7-cyano-7-deazaguanine synthase QueC [Gemmatimonadales bacterium]|nr:7-cyano-7-deazaguanine synthase QueC [Gemmatimonadales bacterium]
MERCGATSRGEAQYARNPRMSMNDPDSPGRALVLFSGGQDSTTCLAWALARFGHVETVGFAYGQRHAVELERREPLRRAIVEGFPQWAPRLGADHLLDLAVLGEISDTALTDERAIAMGEAGLPNTFVPGRNLVFLAMAAAIAYRRGLGVLVAGVCETDFSGYPDCRDDTVKAMQVALNLGMDTRLRIETPLMWIDKADTWALAHRLGGEPLIELIVESTHTCYLGDRAHRHDWGYGCAECPACELRAAGWRAFRCAARDDSPAGLENP